MNNQASSLVIDQSTQRGIELGDDDDDEFNLQSGHDEHEIHERQLSLEDDNIDRVNNGIISNYNSISSDVKNAIIANNKFGIEMTDDIDYPDKLKQDAVDVQVVELGEVELESSHINNNSEKNNKNNENTKVWDMTPLGQ